MKRIILLTVALIGSGAHAQIESSPSPDNPEYPIVWGYGSVSGGNACVDGPSEEQQDDGIAEFLELKKEARSMANKKCFEISPLFGAQPLGLYSIRKVCRIRGYGIEKPEVHVYRNYECVHQW
jgi:hypothetical protein